MAYLLVCTGDASGTESYSLALVWISPHQAQSSTMEEAIGTLSACIFSRPDWPYVLAGLYKGCNHTPLPKDKHLGILPKGKAEDSPYEWISQLKDSQLLSARPRVVYPVGLNGLDELVTIDLPELLHSSWSVTTGNHPHLRIDIPILSPKDPECTTLPLDGALVIPTATTPKTPWKPRFTLTAEVDDLLKMRHCRWLQPQIRTLCIGEGGCYRSRHILIPQSGGPSPANGHFLSSKCRGGGGFPGE